MKGFNCKKCDRVSLEDIMQEMKADCKKDGITIHQWKVFVNGKKKKVQVRNKSRVARKGSKKGFSKFVKIRKRVKRN